MNHHVTVHAGTARIGRTSRGQARGNLLTPHIWASWSATGMRTIMAVITQHWWTIFQQWGDVGTMRCVAVCAVLNDWLMFEQYRAAFLCMTEEAGFIQGVFLKQ